MHPILIAMPTGILAKPLLIFGEKTDRKVVQPMASILLIYQQHGLLLLNTEVGYRDVWGALNTFMNQCIILPY